MLPWVSVFVVYANAAGEVKCFCICLWDKNPHLGVDNSLIYAYMVACSEDGNGHDGPSAGFLKS